MEQQWIEMKDKKPDELQECFVTDEDGDKAIGYYREDIDAWDSPNFGFIETRDRVNNKEAAYEPIGIGKVKAWMPVIEYNNPDESSKKKEPYKRKYVDDYLLSATEVFKILSKYEETAPNITSMRQVQKAHTDIGKLDGVYAKMYHKVDKLTFGDRIRSMSDADLANFIAEMGLHSDGYMFWVPGIGYLPHVDIIEEKLGEEISEISESIQSNP